MLKQQLYPIIDTELLPVNHCTSNSAFDLIILQLLGQKHVFCEENIELFVNNVMVIVVLCPTVGLHKYMAEPLLSL